MQQTKQANELIIYYTLTIVKMTQKLTKELAETL